MHICRFKNKVSSRDIPRYFFRISNVSTSKLFCPAAVLAGPIAEYIVILTAIQIGVMFSTISLIRKFVIRRWFERMRSIEWNGLKNFLKGVYR